MSEKDCQWLHTTDSTPKKEAIYDCWQSAGLDQAVFIIDGKKISLKDLGFPKDSSIGELFTFDKLIEYLEWFELVDDPQRTLRPYMFYLASEAIEQLQMSFHLKRDDLTEEALEAGKKLDKIFKQLGNEKYDDDTANAPFHLTHKNQYYQYQKIQGFIELYSEHFGGEKNRQLSDLLREIKKTCEPILNEEGQNFLFSRSLIWRSRGLGLHPQAAIWHDIWYDPSFPDGALMPRLHMGLVPEGPGFSDMDAGAQESMCNYGLSNQYSKLRTDTEGRPYRWAPTGLAFPPNMTNLYVVHLPGELVGKSSSNKSGGIGFPGNCNLLGIVYCNNPSRLDPVAFPKSLDQKYGSGNWVMVKEGREGLQSVLLKPQKEWTISSRRFNRVNLTDGTNE